MDTSIDNKYEQFKTIHSPHGSIINVYVRESEDPKQDRINFQKILLDIMYRDILYFENKQA